MNLPAVIRVTADHIANGRRHDAFRCAIALAVCEEGGWSPGDLTVGGDSITAPWGSGDILAWLPPDAYGFARDFDDGLPVEPFEFAVAWTRQPEGWTA